MTKDEALKLALEALKIWEQMYPKSSASCYRTPAITALEEVLAQPAQKPVAHIPLKALEQIKPPMLILNDVPIYGYGAEGTVAVYTALPQRPWVGLTDNEINDHRLSLDYDIEDLPDPWDFKQGFRAAERAYGIKDKT